MSKVRLDSQPGPQREFLTSGADIVIYGGGAGGGKSFGLLLDPILKFYFKNPEFNGVIFRRTSPQITNPGGLWDESNKLYNMLGATSSKQALKWTFDSGSNIKFAHMQYEDDKYAWQGSQICLIAFDELTHFSETQFFYMMSRNRSTCGIKPYIRATCNPDSESWVAKFIEWWIDEDTGLPIKERVGRVRYMIRVDDALVWGDSAEELKAQYPEQIPKTVTFIPASVTDNPALLAKDPNYLANLQSLSLVERERLLNGNWKIKAGGEVFRSEWFKIVENYPARCKVMRTWDLAGTAPTSDNPDPDWTVGELWGLYEGEWFLIDLVRARLAPGGVEKLVKATAERDGSLIPIRMEQEPGSSGKAVIEHYAKKVLVGYDFKGVPSTGDKVTRAMPVASAAEFGNVHLLKAGWNDSFISECVTFPNGSHDDQVDPASLAFNQMAHLPAYGIATDMVDDDDDDEVDTFDSFDF